VPDCGDAVSKRADGLPVVPLQQVRDVLHKRMNMKNPHKVWLATHLADDILKKCPDTIGPIKSDIYQVICLARIQGAMATTKVPHERASRCYVHCAL
jgi:hypothetical protein